MKKIFVFLMVFSILLANAIAADQKLEEIKVSLSIETVTPDDEQTIVGFSSTPIASWKSAVTAIPDNGITLTPDPSDGSFRYDSNTTKLYAYAMILNDESVTIDFQASPLKGYKSSTNPGQDDNTAVSDASLNWVLAKGDDEYNLNAEEITDGTIDTDKVIETIFHHKKPFSKWESYNSNVYCVELDISSLDNQDYRQIATQYGVNYWETTLTVLVHSGN